MVPFSQGIWPTWNERKQRNLLQFKILPSSLISLNLILKKSRYISTSSTNHDMHITYFLPFVKCILCCAYCASIIFTVLKKLREQRGQCTIKHKCIRQHDDVIQLKCYQTGTCIEYWLQSDFSGNLQATVVKWLFVRMTWNKNKWQIMNVTDFLPEKAVCSNSSVLYEIYI